MISLNVNGRTHEVDVDPSTPLLWVLRDHLGLTGTKFGCGIAQCGACTVHVDGVARRTCRLAVRGVEGAEITTIEGLSEDGLTPLQEAWLDQDVVQCGYCQSGQIMAASALLASNPEPSDEEIDQAMRRNICRCGAYNRIRLAIRQASGSAPRGGAR
ncbi:MAG: (2Fe-2S)-binding protein [Gemmatimonadetes bacterium]|nr:(2Fe-2S)-binding protein [Gemmatimonadota bacterium]